MKMLKPSCDRRRISSPRSYTNAYDGRFVKGSRAACISLMNVTEYATAEIVHFHLPFGGADEILDQNVEQEVVYVFL